MHQRISACPHFDTGTTMLERDHYPLDMYTCSHCPQCSQYITTHDETNDIVTGPLKEWEQWGHPDTPRGAGRP